MGFVVISAMCSGGFISVGVGWLGGVMRFMAGSGSEVMGVTLHSRGSLRLACAGALEHALRLLEVMRFMVGNASELIGVTAQSS